MATLSYRIVNVFTRGGTLTGNPLCVFEDGRGLDETAMQALARQMNLSETTFILPSDRATARVRIFTPSYEMPFAGHPTLGTAHVVRELLSAGDAVTLEMKAGVIPVAAKGDRWTLQANRPSWREVSESRAELAQMLGLVSGDLVERPLWVNAGKEQLAVPVASADAVRRAAPQADAFRRLKSVDGQSMAYVFADNGDARDSVTARFFFPNGAAILEDPATGSACANLGGWFCAMQPGVDLVREVQQGDEIHRPSTLYLAVRGGEVTVGGDVIALARGTLAL
ncbi:PhzF family phenazine biosynthesis protein [Usitatibacter palustris]|uniref:Trans-2,3-dihydro-3-hydroxyanthranilate isomerase n=1 Tax=Usitatibacter palustris TaxID=2732487 RepID=A0A6M4HBB7_9PROT|nr:PhzF family phenazine biosynthesis protein [Usitatibacter palustris]QJR16886.1 Trans-2,3-dihydro-3-hydroxyanthranilate isomerase [Usitatibacter palustris]